MRVIVGIQFFSLNRELKETEAFSGDFAFHFSAKTDWMRHNRFRGVEKHQVIGLPLLENG